MVMPIAELLTNLTPDPWRSREGFSEELESTQSELFRETSEAAIVRLVNGWISKFQPCLFGRVAAKLDLISYCVLLESDLASPDPFIQDKIQQARLEWLRDGLNGDKSAFVIVAVSQRVAEAKPDAVVQQLARRLCSFYLLQDIQTDHIYLDAIDLELPGRNGSRWRWDVGANYFSAHGDRRWWQDHRIPGGIAFSMNSVGHMVKSGKLARAMKIFEETMAVSNEGWRVPSLDTLDKALIYAMRTIANASEAVSGRATELLPVPNKEATLVKCPVELAADLLDKDFCEYRGWYHTDFTLPSEYFVADVERSRLIAKRDLDFTYLFDDRLSNPDYINMGRGRQVAADDILIKEGNGLTTADRAYKRGRSAGRIVRE